MDLREWLEKLRGETSRLWGALDRRQKVMAVILSLAMVVAMGGLLIWAQTPDYVVAFTGLKEEDAGAIIAKLKEAKIPYQIGADGATIQVPAQKVHEVRLDMARQGLLSGGGVGFEIFNETRFGMTDFAQKLNYQRALEGELARTIGSLAAVDRARVHIVIPQPTLYTEWEKETTASVMLKLKPGAKLAKGQIRGIQQLVSSSVEGLKPEKLTIVDSQGDILSEGYDASPEGASSQTSASRLAIQQQYEKDTEAKVRAMLEEVLGPNKAVVRVNATFDWDQLESNSEIYSPNGPSGSVRSSHLVSERYIGSDFSQVGGVPGTEANWPESSSRAVSSQSGLTETIPPSYERSDATYNYEVSHTVARLVKAPGNLTQLSLAVLLDQVVDDAILTSLKEAAAAAVGLDASRGDTVTLESLAFDRSYYEEEERAMAAAERKELYFMAAKLGGGLLAALALLFLVWRTFRGLQIKPTVLREVVRPVAAPAAEFPEVEIEAVSELQRQGQERQQRVQNQLQALARNEPDAIANVVRRWLMEPSPRETDVSSSS